jgi:hypothetical protein
MSATESTKSLVLPIHVDGKQDTPGPWAARVMALEWPTAQPKTLLLDQISKMRASREPCVIQGRFVDGKSLDYLIGCSVQNVEAIVAQTVGTVSRTPCSRCKAKRNPFSECVTVPSSLSMGSCAPCHWAGNEFGCLPSRDYTRPDIRDEHQLALESRLSAEKINLDEALSQLEDRQGVLGAFIHFMDADEKILSYLHGCAKTGKSTDNDNDTMGRIGTSMKEMIKEMCEAHTSIAKSLDACKEARDNIEALDREMGYRW